ncbi:MAG: recombinase family protein, partial [Tissierellia bacterium]|nr:recombinase family protein [Tissierellia bacterium]
KGPETCDARTIKEEELKAVTVKAINSLIAKRENIKESIKESVKKGLRKDDDKRLVELDKEILKLQEELVKKAMAGDDYDDLEKMIERHREEKEQLLLKQAKVIQRREKLKECSEFIESMEIQIDEYEEELVRKLIQNINVREDGYTVIFKSGIEVEI